MVTLHWLRQSCFGQSSSVCLEIDHLAINLRFFFYLSLFLFIFLSHTLPLSLSSLLVFCLTKLVETMDSCGVKPVYNMFQV
jgi:hypothetical protein